MSAILESLSIPLDILTINRKKSIYYRLFGEVYSFCICIKVSVSDLDGKAAVRD